MAEFNDAAKRKMIRELRKASKLHAGQADKLEKSLPKKVRLSLDVALKKSQKSLKKWTKQKWRTKSGKPSTQGSKATGERYLPEKAIKAMSDKEYAATTRKKRADTKKGKQFSKQPKKVAKKTARHRK